MEGRKEVWKKEGKIREFVRWGTDAIQERRKRRNNRRKEGKGKGYVKERRRMEMQKNNNKSSRERHKKDLLEYPALPGSE